MDSSRWLRPGAKRLPLVAKKWLTMASAICERHELPVHKTKIFRFDEIESTKPSGLISRCFFN